VFENERLHQRMNQFFDRIELSLRQVLRESEVVKLSSTPTVEAQVRASALVSFAQGRLHRFARSGFKKSPMEYLDASLPLFF
jgi:TetR/AcrR family transcriptional regulator